MGEELPIDSQSREYVNIYIHSLEIINLPPDALDGNVAQLQLFAFVTDRTRFKFKNDYFGGSYRTVRVGDPPITLYQPISFDANIASDEVYVWFLAVDTDQIDFPAAFSLDQATDFALNAFSEHLEISTSLSTVMNMNLWTQVVGMAVDAGLGIWQFDDLIGQGAFVLRRSENWNVNHYGLVSGDNSIRIDYEVRISDQRPLEVAQQTISSSPIYSSESSACPGAPSTTFKIGQRVVVDFNNDGALRILQSPHGGATEVLAQAYDNQELGLMDGPVCGSYRGQNVWYWRVHYKITRRDGSVLEAWGWAAEGIRGDRWLCPLDNRECGS